MGCSVSARQKQDARGMRLWMERSAGDWGGGSLGLGVLAANTKNNSVFSEKAGRGKARLHNHIFVPITKYNVQNCVVNKYWVVINIFWVLVSTKSLSLEMTSPHSPQNTSVAEVSQVDVLSQWIAVPLPWQVGAGRYTSPTLRQLAASLGTKWE